MSPRTSKTHPLRVDWLPEGLAAMPGRLGITFAPGKSARSKFGAPWERDLDSDIARLADDHEVDCLVTLLEEPELESLGIADLFDSALDRDIDVYWWSLPDGTAPDDEQGMETTKALVDHIMSRVYGGQNVVVHCRGGLGRSGTIVGSCLRAIEYAPEKVFDLVRNARPGAIENRSQERFVEGYRAPWFPGRSMGCIGHKYWRYLERQDDFGDPQPDDYPTHILSRIPGHDPAIRFFSSYLPELSTGEKTHRSDLTEQAVLEYFTRCIHPDVLEISTEERDQVIDCAVTNQPLTVSPELAAGALAHLFDSRIYEHLHDRFTDHDLPHIRNAARRLFAATRGFEVPTDACTDDEAAYIWRTTFADQRDRLQTRIDSKIWDDEPIHHFELPDNPRLFRYATPCALSFDGYRFRKEQVRDDHRIIDELIEHANYDDFTVIEKRIVFFILQRGLGGRGCARSAKDAGIRRVFRELFLELSTDLIPRHQSCRDQYDWYYKWRWGLYPVAEVFRDLARRELHQIDYKYE